MADLQVRPVTSRAEQKRFIQLPWRIYRDDPCWMPPLVMAQEELLGLHMTSSDNFGFAHDDSS